MVAVLFADISGSTRLYELLGDERAHRVVALCLDTMRASVAEFQGRVIKSIGDALLCVFVDADAAITAASEIQSRLAAQRRADSSIPAIRIGVSYGPVLEEGDDVFGDTVNVAARVVGLATAGQVLTTRQTVDALPPLARSACRELYAISVKGIEEKVGICDVVWKLDADLTLLTGNQAAPAAERARVLRLTYGGRDTCVGAERRRVGLGRDPQNDVVVTSRMASRHHAHVHLYEGNFVLVDESANGTYVRFDAQSELHLRREETILTGCGVIGLGASTGADEAATVAFAVQTPAGVNVDSP